MEQLHELNTEKFKVVVQGKQYVIFSKLNTNTGATWYEAHDDLFGIIKLYPIDCPNPLCLAIDGSKVNDLSKEFSAAIEAYYM